MERTTGKIVAWLGVLGLLIAGSRAWAVEILYDLKVADGNWNTATSWNPESVPTAADYAVVQNGGKVTITAPAVAHRVFVGGFSGHNCRMEIGSDLSMDGAFNITRQNANARSSVLQTGGTVMAYDLNVPAGECSYTQQAGRVVVANTMVVSWGDPGDTSRYVLVSGSLEPATLSIGRMGYGTGVFIQHGGIVSNNSETTVGYGADGAGLGYYYQNGGTNYCATLYVARNSFGGLYVITNGDLRVSSALYLAYSSPGVGEMQIGGTASVVSPTVSLGGSEGGSSQCTGIWTQVGGTVNASTYFVISHSGQSKGLCTLGGGTLTTPRLWVGYGMGSSGDATFTQTGGVLAVSGAISVGYAGSVTGRFHTVGMAPQASCGSYGQDSKGTLQVTLVQNGGMRPIAVGGTATLAGALTIGRTNNALFEPGMVVTVMTYNACSTQFAQTNFLDGMSCRVNYLSDRITLDQLQPVLIRGTIVSMR